MTWRECARQGSDESGASLIIALVFVIATALIILALVQLTGNSLLNASNLQTDRSTNYAADGVIDGAIQTLRFDADSATTSACQDTTAEFAPSAGIDGQILSAYCTNVGIAGTQSQNPPRFVTLDACPPIPSGQTLSWCVNNNVLEALVEIVDQHCTTPTNCTASVGYSITVQSWVVKRANE